MFSLKGKICVVTGAGRGLGASIVKVLMDERATVVACDIREDFLEQLKSETVGKKMHTVKMDVSDIENVRTCINDTIEEFGGIDVLVNNAAIDVTRPLDEVSVTEWDRVLMVNLRGPFLMSKFAYHFMVKEGKGHIINIVSTASKRTWPNATAYHASKWGLLGFSHALHSEARSKNVKVTALVSGGMKTQFLLERFPDIDASTLQNPDNVASTVKFILQQPEETVIPEVMVLPMRETSWP